MPRIETSRHTSSKEEIMAKLDALDMKSIRAVRAITSGNGTDKDKEMLKDFEAQAQALREQLASA